MFDQLMLGVGLLIVAYASYVDWWTTEVPDWLTYLGISIGLGSRAMYSFIESDWSFFMAGLIAFGILAAIGCLLYYTAQWGGGDTKLLMALGALLGIEPIMNGSLVAFLLNLLIVGGAYGLVYTMVLGVRHRKKTSKHLKRLVSSREGIQIKALSYSTALLFLILAFFTHDFLKTGLIVGAMVLPMSFYVWLFTKSVEDAALVKKIDPDVLTEGDWVLDTIIHKGKEICSPKDPGVSLKQIAQLRALKQKGVIRTITMKQGIPFIPAFLIAYVLMLTVGNLLLFLI